MQRHRIHDDDDRAGDYPGGAHPGDGTSNDEYCRTWSSSTEGRADFEDGNCRQKDPFGGVEGVDSAKDELDSTTRDEIRAGVPTDIAQGIKLIGYRRDGGSDDGPVLSGFVSHFAWSGFLCSLPKR